MAATAVVAGTFVGGSGADGAVGLALLPSGDTIAAGNTASPDFPATAGAPAGGQDVWLSRFAAGFASRAWTVRLGGSGEDTAVALAVDASGDVYLAGHTESPDFPAAAAYDATFNGSRDVFLVKLDGATGAVLFATYLGGALDEEAQGLAVDDAGRAFVVGGTFSPDFPQAAAIGADGPGRDAFFSQFSADGASLPFSSYYGGVYDEEARAVALDNLGDAYIAIFAADPGGFGLDHNRVVKLGGPLRAETYSFPFGPQPPDAADGLIRIDDLVVDGLGRAIFAGTTESLGSLPVVAAWQPASGGGADFFLARLDAGGAALELSTYLGGEETESRPSLTLGADDSIAVAGASNSYNYPLRRPLDAQLAGYDGVLTRFAEDAQGLLSSTFFGGSGEDRIAAVAIDSTGVAWVAGVTASPELAITGLLPGGAPPDGFAARLAPVGIARFLPLRTVALAEPGQVPDPYLAIDFDGDGEAEELSFDPALPLAASSYASRRGDGRDLLSVVLGTLGGVAVAGVIDVDLDGEQELLVDDPSRDRGFFEGWLLDNRDLDVDLVVRGIGGDAGLLLADLDGDLENELVVRDPLGADASFEDLDNGELPPDGDAEVVFLGGRPRAALDLDDDGEIELVAELVSGPNGTIVARDGVAGEDGDDDVLFVRGEYQLAADLNGDRRPELAFTYPGLAAGSVTLDGQVLFLGGTARTAADLDGDGRLELVADSPGLAAGFSSLSAPGVVFLGGSFLGLADIDGDGEAEVLAISAAQAPGSYGLGIALESPADLDPDIVFLPAGARGVADLDGDGELEIVVDGDGPAAGTFTTAGGLEANSDGDPDVVFLGGQLMLFADLDGDGETELMVHDAAAAAGTASAAGGVESPADSDRDIVFMAGTARLAEDLDGDGESEVGADGGVGAVTVLRGLDAPGDGDADLVYTPGVVARVADLDGDGENELIAAELSLAAGSATTYAALESPADADPDVVVLGGEPRLAGDLDGDGETELTAEAPALAPGAVVVLRAIDQPGDGDADVVFVRGGAARLADVDGDGENELLASDAAAAGPGGALIASLASPPGPDTGVVFLGGVLRAVGDLDGDGEPEVLAEAAIAAGTTMVLEAESAPDGDPDLIFTGGRARGLGDLDGDGENEAAIEAAGLTPGTTETESGLEGLPDGDADLVYTGGVVQALADLDDDGELELATTDERIAGGSSFYQRDLDLEPPAAGDPDVAFLGTGVVSGVRDPNGGEIWYIGSTQAIHWDLPSPGNVRVEISRDGGASWTNIIGSTPDDGEQLWDVRGAPTSEALVRVTSRDNPAVTDTSDSVFTIPPAAITLLSPNGGETFSVGQQIEIAWASENLAGGIEVALSRDGGATWEILDATTPNDGAKTITVAGPATGQAVFRVRSAVENTVADSGDGMSAISGASLALTSPNGGETLLIGSTAAITWSSSGLAGAVHVDLSRDGGATWERILTNTANDGSQPWNVGGPPTSAALVRVQSVGSPAISDLGDATFTIPPASLAVSSPNGGETVLLASLVNLQWSSASLGGNVRIELSRDGGATFEVLFATTPNDGTQSWRVIGAPSSQALLRVSSRNEPAVADTSDATFTIPPASLTVTSPNGGETWTVGSARTVTWTSTGLGGQVDIELSRDGGATWSVLVATTANDGAQGILVPGPATTQALVRVRSIHVAVLDSSDAVFTIP